MNRPALTYPATPRSDHVDVIHGTHIPDPYRWLEEINAPQTAEWIAAQNQLTFDYLEHIPARSAIKERVTELWNYEKYGVPFKRGGRYFLTRNDGLQNQSVLYWLASLEAEPRMLLDPNILSEDGTVALTGYAASEDGRFLAYGLSASGSDWQEWFVREVDTGRDLEDHLQWVKFSDASWTHDGRGFFYSRYDEPQGGVELKSANYYHKLYYHRLGTPQAEDVLVYERPDQKEWGFGGYVTEDGRYLIIVVWQGTRRENGIFYKDLQAPAGEIIELLVDFDAEYNFVGNDGGLFYFQTDLDAPLSRAIAIDVTQPERSRWREVIAESGDALQGTSLVGGQFIAHYLRDAHSHVLVLDKSGHVRREIELPGLGSVSGLDGRQEDAETFYLFAGFTTPGTIYHYDVQTGESTLFRQPQLRFDPGDYVTEQVFYQSKDGTRVPMYVSYKKGLPPDGNRPTYLYGYGGFNIPLLPSFSVSNLVWMQMGGTFAQANLRGGGEYGTPWHEAGMKLNKQNVFDDFIAAAEWLIDRGYTSTPRLAIGGGSNGGLLVGACLTQRPDLFGACLLSVGVLDMLRFDQFTIGWAWTSDYGSPQDPEEFEALHAYSPYHNIKPGTAYPATLITTGDHDDRVFPAHSFKFAAALQAAQGGPAPILIRIETKAGHGAGKPTSKLIQEAADRWAFLVRVLDMAGAVGDHAKPV
jgi:prolyl oligopeptidase